MEHVYVCLPDAKTVQAFVHALAALDGDYELVSDGFILDARSLMGIFSLDLAKPMRLDLPVGEAAAAKAALADFIVAAPDTPGAAGKEAENG